MNKQKQAKPSPLDEKWAEAKRLCRLSTRQIEMAKALGMNPKKLPGLRPSKSQQWKAPVGQFIEECYAKRFGDPPNSKRPGRTAQSNGTKTPRSGATGGSQRAVAGLFSGASASTSPSKAASKAASVRQQDLAGQATDLLVYLVNLADDIEDTLAAAVTPELLAALSTALHDVATQLANGESISPFFEIERIGW